MSFSSIVITNCTARKKGAAERLKLSSDSLEGGLPAVAAQWKKELAGHTPRVEAQHLYTGRAIGDAKRTATLLSAPLFFASAGLGLIAASDLAAPYDLTVAKNAAGLGEVLQTHNGTPADWWELLCGENSLSDLLQQNPEATLFIALPASYVALLKRDLATVVSRGQHDRLRLFTSRVGVNELPAGLASAVMPYDERLESLPGFSGTRSDFPQRAMRHFVEILDGHKFAQIAARQVVESGLATFQAPDRVIRTRCSDEQIKAMLRYKLSISDGRGIGLLRYLRDEVGVACEQGRFSQLWHEVRQEHTAKAT